MLDDSDRQHPQNVVAQCFQAEGRRLFFYSGPARKAGTEGEEDLKRLEIDLLIRRKRKICPIEVKSSERLTHSSLDESVRRFGEGDRSAASAVHQGRP